jgi:D-glycero-D-manno-heptose 1,7-bisphosphate phosphatase
VGNGPLRRAIFFDRDGVLNEAVVRAGLPYPPDGPHQVRIARDAPRLLAELRAAGFALLVVTNQPDVARGTRTRLEIERVHARLAEALPLDGFYVCDHDDADRCDCRKPLPGLLARAAHEHGIDLAGSYLVGDRWKDIAAGQAAGVRTVFIDFGYAERGPIPPADATVADLEGAISWIRNVERNAGEFAQG